MSSNAGLLVGGIVANIAFVGSRIAMSPLMCNKVVFSFAGIIAFATFEWLFPRMCFFMGLQIADVVGTIKAF